MVGAERIPKLMKTSWWPQPHRLQGSFSFELDDVTLDTTILPIAFYDEGLGAPSALETHPENAAFAIVTDQANYYFVLVLSNLDVVLQNLDLNSFSLPLFPLFGSLF